MPVRRRCLARIASIPTSSKISRLARLRAASQGGGLQRRNVSAPGAGSTWSRISNRVSWTLLHQPCRWLGIAAWCRVNEGTSDPACPTVEIFVGTPDSKVNAPFIEVQGHIAHCMSQVPANLCSNSLALSCDDVHLELLPGVVLHPAEHDEGDGVAFPSDRLHDVLRPDRLLARSQR